MRNLTWLISSVRKILFCTCCRASRSLAWGILLMCVVTGVPRGACVSLPSRRQASALRASSRNRAGPRVLQCRDLHHPSTPPLLTGPLTLLRRQPGAGRMAGGRGLTAAPAELTDCGEASVPRGGTGEVAGASRARDERYAGALPAPVAV